jgi:hypothetical protein
VDVTAVGRRIRLVVTLVLAVGILYGTLWGVDDDFPFAPFRMYSTSRDLNEPTGDTLLVVTDADGERFEFKDTEETGIRRSEIEGQLDRFRSDPSLLGFVADAYEENHPDDPPVAELQVVIRWFELEDGRATGEWHDEVVATWTP